MVEEQRNIKLINSKIARIRKIFLFQSRSFRHVEGGESIYKTGMVHATPTLSLDT